MIFVLLTLVACLALSAAVALYVAYPARGRALPGAERQVGASRSRQEQKHDAGGPQVGGAAVESRT